MKRVRYTKFTGDLASEMDIEDLLKALSDYLLDSGFHDPYLRFQDLDHTLDDLREALRQLLESGECSTTASAQKLEQMGERRQARRAHRQAHPAHGAGELHLLLAEHEPHADRRK